MCSDCFNRQRSNQPKQSWSLGSDILTETSTYTHLGLLCDEHMSSSVLVDEGIKKLRGTLGSIIRSGFTAGEINPLTLRKIYCSVVLPKAFYGAQWTVPQLSITMTSRTVMLYPSVTSKRR